MWLSGAGGLRMHGVAEVDDRHRRRENEQSSNHFNLLKATCSLDRYVVPDRGT